MTKYTNMFFLTSRNVCLKYKKAAMQFKPAGLLSILCRIA